MVWRSPTHLARLERIQHKFPIWLACSSGHQTQSLDYPLLLKRFKVPSIKARFQQHDLLFMFSAFRARFDSSYILSSYHLSTPMRRNRNPVLWHVPFARVNTIQNCPFHRIPALTNSFLAFSPGTDFFTTPYTNYKRAVRRFTALNGSF